MSVPSPGGSPSLAGLRDRVLEQVGRVVVGQEAVAEGILGALVIGGHVLLEGRARRRQDAARRDRRPDALARLRRVQFTPDLMPSDITGTDDRCEAGELAFQLRARSSPTSCSPTRSTGRRRRPRRRCSRRCRSARSPSTAAAPAARARSSSSRRRTRSSRRARIRCPRPSSTASSRGSRSAIPTSIRSGRCSRCGRAACGRPGSPTSLASPDPGISPRARAAGSTPSWCPTPVRDYVVARRAPDPRRCPACRSAPRRGRPCHCSAWPRRPRALAGRVFLIPDDVAAARPAGPAATGS